MKKRILSIEYTEYKHPSKLSKEDSTLITAAQQTSQDAYAPYSHFRVGAAVRLDNGMIICGNNQENAAYPLGLCAERTALFAAMAQHPQQKIEAIAIFPHPENLDGQTYAFPCGGCRQVLAQCQQRAENSIKIILATTAQPVLVFEGAEQLLPFPFWMVK
jgi:cytidine deaminase